MKIKGKKPRGGCGVERERERQREREREREREQDSQVSPPPPVTSCISFLGVRLRGKARKGERL
jgi:hypothetical protein